MIVVTRFISIFRELLSIVLAVASLRFERCIAPCPRWFDILGKFCRLLDRYLLDRKQLAICYSSCTNAKRHFFS
jgi:hypothetical protein